MRWTETVGRVSIASKTKTSRFMCITRDTEGGCLTHHLMIFKRFAKSVTQSSANIPKVESGGGLVLMSARIACISKTALNAGRNHSKIWGVRRSVARARGVRRSSLGFQWSMAQKTLQSQEEHSLRLLLTFAGLELRAFFQDKNLGLCLREAFCVTISLIWRWSRQGQVVVFVSSPFVLRS